MIDSEHYEVIRQQVEQRFKQRYAFYTHIAVYALVSIILWLIYGFTTGMAGELAARFPFPGVYTLLSFPWPLIVMAGWGIGVIVHGINYYIRYGGGALRRREAIQCEIEREMTLRYGYEKPKNNSEMRLTDDGELEEVVDVGDNMLVGKQKR